MKQLIDKLAKEKNLSDDELKMLIDNDGSDVYLRQSADRVRREVYGNSVYIRGLIEFTNYCKNDCYYCGIRASNSKAVRYRLDKDTILACCKTGYALGFRTFVLQGGEDPFFDDDVLCDIVFSIKSLYPDCAITLSVGERSYESYKRLFESGADRYLLRHETAEGEHYSRLHPEKLSLDVRKECLFNLKQIGYQVGSGFMIGSPYQTTDNLVSDLRFLQELEPDMVGIGPFICHKDTPFADKLSGTAEKTLKMLAIVRLMFPYVLLPSTTALGTISPNGREEGIKSGANVVMPNLSPQDVRENYLLYDNKIATGAEAAESLKDLKERIESIGYRIEVARGDVAKHG